MIKVACDYNIKEDIGFILESEKINNIENPKTGDNVGFYIVTSVLSIIGIAGSGLYGYKRKQKN